MLVKPRVAADFGLIFMKCEICFADKYVVIIEKVSDRRAGAEKWLKSFIHASRRVVAFSRQ